MHAASRRRLFFIPRLTLGQTRNKSDYIVIGAGSAGCVITRRLLDQGASVTLIESGPKDYGRWDSWTIQMPAALTYNVADKRYNYDYHTIPQKHLNGRRIHEPRGRALGGSSSINAMVYVRGHALDFQRWAKEERAGDDWDYASVLPYFKRAQGHSKVYSSSTYRGLNGPLKVKTYDPDARETTNVLFDVFRDAGVQAGYPKTNDINGFQQEGFGPFDMTINPMSGKRCSAAVAYLHPVLKHANLKLITGKNVNKVRFKEKTAIGVDLDDGTFLEASNEVILCAGAINSPQLLMLSGIGPKEHLESHGISVIANNPQVGLNFQDHLEVYLQYLCLKPVTLFPVGNWTLKYLHRRVGVGLEWFLRGTGIGASNQFETGGFIRTRAGVQHPDVQYHFIPGAVLGQLEFLPFHAFQVHVGTLRPTSRGSVRLSSADPRAEPLIDPNFLATEQDRIDMRNAAKLAEEIVRQPAFDSFRGDRIRPTRGEVPDVFKNDELLDKWMAESSHSAYHPSCSCAMGRVVDDQGRVDGVQRLRVVDASIMPSMTSGNLNAPTIMMAEKISDRILGKTPLPREESKWWVNPTWKDTQR